ncbi:MAG: SpoIIIAH-like family protein [Oscillospiraceae bacterium]
MKVLKRNIVVITVLLFVCVAVYLNWSYGETETEAGSTAGTEDSVGAEAPSSEVLETEEGAGLYYEDTSGTLTSDMKEYFDTVRLNRQTARDEATETLQTITETSGTSQELIDSSLENIATIAKWTMQEAEIESLIMAKGFDDCVVFMTDDGINVTVPTEEGGLSTASVAKITDIVTSETDFGADVLKIIEIK